MNLLFSDRTNVTSSPRARDAPSTTSSTPSPSVRAAPFSCRYVLSYQYLAENLKYLTFQDFVYIDEIAHFDRERIPERVVHAKGTGAFGYFEVTKDITKYCKASLTKQKRNSIQVQTPQKN